MKLKLTFLAIKNSIGIHIAAIILLSFLFYSEVSLYHYFYQASINHYDNNSSKLAKSSYTFVLNDDVNKDVLELLDKDLKVVSTYEDIAVIGQISFDDIKKENPTAVLDEGTDVVSFYPEMSNLHSFKSYATNETFHSSPSENVVWLRSGDLFTSNECTLNGKQYNVVKDVWGLHSYMTNNWFDVMCVPYSDFWNISSDSNQIVLEFEKKLNADQLSQVEELIEKRIDVEEVIIPKESIDVSSSVIEDNILNLTIVFIVMVIATSCILPIIKYCLWKRHYEFSSYRMCGADHSFIRDCEFIQVTIIGLCSILLGIVLSINKLDTEGFIIVLLLSSVLFFIRLLAEVLIDSRSSRNVMEVNKKWKL